ncbi:uncharacterized protein N7482_009180 [Penicillium canariense]|uniref:Uncharacterized protein n=1 Tax=Penicillium canariense TaxID=189055 RepID=A0A9W9HNM7_9EURO|nr:uncharacterized protein N7482_009180 [Penicillium canariense]KAJ5152702.1 hypothetical protein N7482_009180 [Penicillium canariense]
MFRITRAEPWAIDTGNWCLFSSEPKLCFQITQGSSWKQDSMFPVYNIWSPAYFGISLPQPDSKPYKLSCNDLIVTSYDDDIASLKVGDTGAIPFEAENTIGGIDVDYPGFLCCRCCLRYRGWVTLANGELWRFDENDQSYYQFQRVHKGVDDGKFPKVYPKTLIWERFRDWESGYGEAPAEVPFIMDRDTRLCRVNLEHRGRHWDTSGLIAPVIAIMNREGLVFVDGLEHGHEIETANLRELVLMTGLTVAKFERPALEQ